MTIADTTERPDTYMPDAAYDRLLGELAIMFDHPDRHPHDCPQTAAVELLGEVAGVWPERARPAPSQEVQP